MIAVDILIVGAGPAGMSAAIEARKHGLSVIVVDDQPKVGGQIWRSIEVAKPMDDVLGPTYTAGRKLAEEFKASGATHLAGAQVWQIEPGYRVFLSEAGEPAIIDAKVMLLATGAQERPVPFPGWTLPGVMTVGAAQILMKSASQIPEESVWIAGSGPLPLLYATQLLGAGGKIAGYLDTTPRGQWKKAIPHLPKALAAAGDLIKGMAWTARLRTSSVPYIDNVTDIEVDGCERVERLRFRRGRGAWRTVETGLVLVHEGVVPQVHPAMSLGCEMEWDSAQDCFRPRVDKWGESSLSNLFVAGDGAGIAGAKAAVYRGQMAALRAAGNLGLITEGFAELAAKPVLVSLKRELAVRPFLDALFRPHPRVLAPSGNTIVCRCEGVTANEIRTVAGLGRPGPNQVKAATRAGMGPCQGRQCGYSVARLIAAEQGSQVSDVGYLHVRPPLKPVTLGELAAVEKALA